MRHQQQASVLLGVWVLLAAGCTQQDPATLAKQHIQRVQSAASAHVDPLPAFSTPELADDYIQGARQDPFVSWNQITEAKTLDKIAKASGPHPDGHEPEPLEAYPVDGLKMMGAYRISGVFWALVKAPDGQVHKIKIGNHLGKHSGTVIRVDRGSVTFTELLPNGLGGWTKRESSLSVK